MPAYYIYYFLVPGGWGVNCCFYLWSSLSEKWCRVVPASWACPPTPLFHPGPWQKEQTLLYPKPWRLSFAFGTCSLPHLWSHWAMTKKKIWGNFQPGREGDRRCLFWASLSTCGTCCDLGTQGLSPGSAQWGTWPLSNHRLTQRPHGLRLSHDDWRDCWAWMGTWSYCKISLKLHSSVAGCRSFARQVEQCNLLLPQGALVTLGKKCCWLYNRVNDAYLVHESPVKPSYKVLFLLTNGHSTWQLLCGTMFWIGAPATSAGSKESITANFCCVKM